MGKVFNNVKSIWADLDKSYEVQSNYSTRKEYLAAISGYSSGGKLLPWLLAQLDEEAIQDESILDEVKSYSSIIELVSRNLDRIMTEEIHSFDSMIKGLIYGEVGKVNSNEDLEFGYKEADSIILSELQMLFRFSSLSTCSEIVNGELKVYSLAPIKYHKAIALSTNLSMIELNELYTGDDRYYESTYVSHVISVYKQLYKEEVSSAIFIPKGLYRKTANGYNVYAENTIKVIGSREIDNCVVCDHHGIKVVLVPHESVH